MSTINDKKGFEVLKHRLVPKHEILSEEEKKEIVEKYGGDPYLFPFIYASDPVIKTLGAKPGDLIKITRISPTGYRALYFRLVVEE